MAEEGIDALVVFSPENTHYVTGGFNPGIQSMTTVGVVIPSQTRPILVASSLRVPLSDVLPGERLVYNYGVWYGEDAAGETWQEALQKAFSDHAPKPIRSVGIEARIPLEFYEQLQVLFDKASLTKVDSLINQCRDLKDPDELENIRKADVVATAGKVAARAALEANAQSAQNSEQRVAVIAKSAMWRCLMENFPEARNTGFGSQEGANFDAFQIWILSGKRRWLQSDCPTSHVPKNEAVNFLIWAGINGYHAEVEDSVCVGIVPSLDKAIIQDYQYIRDHCLALIKPDVPVNKIYEAAVALYKERGHHPVLRIGHGVGLGPHEHLSINAKTTTLLKPGMAITIEPNIRVPGKAQTQISTTLIVTESGWKYANDLAM